MKKYLPDFPFLRHLGQLLSGNIVAQALPILCIPLLSRYYTPADFGEWGLFVAVVGITTIISTGRLDMAIVVPAEERNAINLGVALLMLSCTVSVVMFFAVLAIGVFAPSLLSIAAGRSVTLTAALLAVSLCLGSIRQGINYWLYRGHLYQHVYTANIIRAVGYCVIAVVAGLFQNSVSSVNGMVAGTAAGEATAFAYGFYAVIRRIKFEWPTWSAVRATVARHKHFMTWGVPGDLLNTLSNQLPLFFLSRYMDAGSVGHFVMARRALSAPTTLLSKSTGDVFVAYSSEDLRRKGECRDLFLKTTGMLSMVAFPIFIVLMIVSPVVFPFVLGSQWVLAGELAQPLAVLCCLGFIASTLGRVLQVAERQKIDFLWQLLLFAFVTASIVGIVLGCSIIQFTWLFSILYGSCYLIYFFISYRVACRPKQNFAGGFF